MVHYYCFIPVSGAILPTQKIFKVSVGKSKRDTEKARLVELYAQDSNLYFHLWSDDAIREIEHRLALHPEASFSVDSGCRIVYCSISSLLKAIISDSVDTLNDPAYVFRNYFKLHSLLSPSFFFSNFSKSVSRPRASQIRKNLSVRPSSDDICAAIGFGCVLLLYWLGCLLRSWEQSLF